MTPSSISRCTDSEIVSSLSPPLWMKIAFLVLLLSLLTSAASIFPIESEYIFSNIVTGNYLWTHRSIPERDPFSFTGPHRWLVNRAFLMPLPSTADGVVQLHKFLWADPRLGLAHFDDTTMLFARRDEAALRGIPLFSYITPFTGADEIIKNRPNGAAVLERDFEVGESINPNSVAFLTMNTRFLKSIGQGGRATETARRMVSLCKEIDRTELCQANCRKQLLAMGRYDLARELGS